MPNDEITKPLPAQITATIDVSVEARHSGEDVCSEFQARTMELFPQSDSVAISVSNDAESLSIILAPRDALEMAKKLMAMCAAYTEDIGACDPCGELYPTEELHDLQTCVGDTTACTRCMESGR